MNVCLMNDSFPPVIDGVANVVTNYAEYLTKDLGAKVAVATPRYPDADYSGYPYAVLPYQSIDTTAIASGYRAGYPFSPKYLDELKAFAPDIIHSHCPASSNVLARLLRDATDAPVVFTYHTKYDIDIERMFHSRLASREAIKAMVSTIEACDEVWTVSRGAGENLRSLGFTGDYRVMNNGVDFAKGRVSGDRVAQAVRAAEEEHGFRLPEGVPVYLFVGRMMTYKGLPLILDALKLLRDSGRDFRMIFIGKGPDKELLENKTKELGLADRCFFLGAIYDRDVLRAWNTRADLFLFPSTFDTNGLVVREAAACGLASVLIKGSCAAEGITDGVNGFTIDETPEAMAALLERIGGDMPCLRETGQHAMDEIYLSWEDCVKTAYARYEEILEAKKSGLLVPKKQAVDALVEVISEVRDERAESLNALEEMLTEFGDTAVGMMENIVERWRR